jgi:hypothetical protein
MVWCELASAEGAQRPGAGWIGLPPRGLDVQNLAAWFL